MQPQKWKKVVLKKKDTHKIKTNPRYKCLDEAASEEDEENEAKHDEQNLSSKELDFRETIIKAERKKRRKERKLKEKELKRLKAANGEDDSKGADPSV